MKVGISMRLKISNLAQIKDAEIEERQLVLIVGDNGSGKTLLLETVFLIKYLYQEIVDNFIKKYLKESSKNISLDFDWDRVNNQLKSIKEDQLKKIPDIELNVKIEDKEGLNELFQQEIKAAHDGILNKVNTDILFEEQSSFDFSLEDLPEAQQEFNLHLEMFTQYRTLVGTIYRNKGDLYYERFVLITYDELDDIEGSDLNVLNLKGFRTMRSNIEDKIKTCVLKVLFKSYFSKGGALFLPSERNIFMDNALRKASLNSLHSDKIKHRYSESLFYSAYLSYKDHAEQFVNIFRTIGEDLASLFDGKLKYSEDGEIESICKSDGTIVRRELFSTKQSRTIPFLLIHDPFEDYKQIVIEEPEAHLSIKSMSDFLFYIFSLLKSVDNVFLTTHSDVFFSRINNELVKDENIDVKVYELKTVGLFSTLEEVSRTEYGYSIQLFSNELNKLYDETIKIQQSIN